MRFAIAIILLGFLTGISCSKKDSTDARNVLDIKGEKPLTPEEKDLLVKLAGLSPANLGFHLVEGATSVHLLETQKTVFHIFNPAGEKLLLPEMMRRAGVNSVQALIEKMSSALNNASSNEDRINVDLVTAQIKRCQEKSIKENECVIFADMSSGTAFITGDGTDLWTALHNLRDELMTDISQIDFQLYNSNYALVFDSFTQPVKFQKPDEAFVKEGPQGEGVRCSRFLTDWLHIKLPQSLGKGLAISQKRIHRQEGYYIVGYPKETTDRRSYDPKISDSGGKALYYTSGQVRAEEAKLLLGKCPEQMGDSINDVIIIDADSYKRMSGGPIINNSGEAVGVYNYSFPANGKANPYYTSIGSGFSQILK